MLNKLLIIILLISPLCHCQNKISFIIKNSKTNESLAGVNAVIKSLNIGARSDSSGIATLQNVPNGKYEITFSSIGYKEKEIEVKFPPEDDDKEMTVKLEETEVELSGITISSTRTNSMIDDVPIRVEVLGVEEIEEKTGSRPSNISTLLVEASGVHVQQTSATSGNVRVRMQGLDGKYTQLLKDGFPMFGGFSSGLSFMQIPPLDLKQVEIIKGSSSALSGGDAIAGVINIISRNPGEKTEWLFIANQTLKKGRDFGSYFSGKKGEFGITFQANVSMQEAYDVDGDGFADIPYLQLSTINPTFFYNPDKNTSIALGLTSISENRKGGDIYAIEKGADSNHPYIEENSSKRNFTRFTLEHKFENGNLLTVKNSFNFFNRDIVSQYDKFFGSQVSSYSEASYLIDINSDKLVLGLNILSDVFKERMLEHNPAEDYAYYTYGSFVQYDRKIENSLIVQAGIRFDYHNKHGLFTLPRVSLKYNPSKDLTMRIGGGFGYKAPTIFDSGAEDDEHTARPALAADIKPEKSIGGNFDINYKTILFGELSCSLNQAFFYTRITDPVRLIENSNSKIFANAAGHIETKGAETNFQLILDDYKFYGAYTFSDAKNNYDANKYVPLSPRSKLYLNLNYENEDFLRLGLEAYFNSGIYLSDGTKVKDYWIDGIFAEVIFGNVSFILNVENLFDERMTRHENLITNTLQNPVIKEIYSPIDGVMTMFAVKVKI